MIKDGSEGNDKNRKIILPIFRCHHVSQIDEDSIILPVTINVLDQASER